MCSLQTKKNAVKVLILNPTVTPPTSAHPKTVQAPITSTTTAASRATTATLSKPRATAPVVSTRNTAPRLVAQAEKNAAAAAAQTGASSAAVRMPIQNTSGTSTRAPVSKPIGVSTANQTFAAKLTEITSINGLPSGLSQVHQAAAKPRNAPASGSMQPASVVSSQPPSHTANMHTVSY